MDNIKVTDNAEKVQKSEIEELSEIAAKNPVDKFIISEKPDVEVMQGDILIWSDITEEYKKNFPLVTNLKETDRMVLQDGDSLTGDHELVPLKGSKFTLMKGEFRPPVIESAMWSGRTYDCRILEIDKPFVIKHREHGNITLQKGKYMICSSLDSETLDRMRD